MREAEEDAAAVVAAAVAAALRKGGLASGGVERREAWMRMLQRAAANAASTPPSPPPKTTTTTTSKPPSPSAKTLEQIALDVARSYGDAKDQDVEGPAKRARLSRLLTRFARENPDLEYFQGFHDVARLMLDVFSSTLTTPMPTSTPTPTPTPTPTKEDQQEQRALACLVLASRTLVLRDAHRSDFDAVVAWLWMVHRLAAQAPRAVRVASVVPQLKDPFWAVSLLISCFAHDVADRSAAARLWDAIIARAATGDVFFPGFLAASLALSTPKVEASPTEPDDAHALAHARVRSAARSLDVDGADRLVEAAVALQRRVGDWTTLDGDPAMPIDSMLFPALQRARRARVVQRKQARMLMLALATMVVVAPVLSWVWRRHRSLLALS